MKMICSIATVIVFNVSTSLPLAFMKQLITPPQVKKIEKTDYNNLKVLNNYSSFLESVFLRSLQNGEIIYYKDGTK